MGSETLHKHLDDRGLLEIQRLAPGVLFFIERGYLPAVCGQAIVDAKDRELKLVPRLTLFIDAEGLDGYDPPVRTMPTDWIKAHASQVVAQHMLVRSQIARMGLAVAGLALGTVIRGHTSRLEFERRLREAVQQSSRESPKSV